MCSHCEIFCKVRREARGEELVEFLSHINWLFTDLLLKRRLHSAVGTCTGPGLWPPGKNSAPPQSVRHTLAASGSDLPVAVIKSLPGASSPSFSLRRPLEACRFDALQRQSLAKLSLALRAPEEPPRVEEELAKPQGPTLEDDHLAMPSLAM